MQASRDTMFLNMLSEAESKVVAFDEESVTTAEMWDLGNHLYGRPLRDTKTLTLSFDSSAKDINHQVLDLRSTAVFYMPLKKLLQLHILDVESSTILASYEEDVIWKLDQMSKVEVPSSNLYLKTETEFRHSYRIEKNLEGPGRRFILIQLDNEVVTQLKGNYQWKGLPKVEDATCKLVESLLNHQVTDGGKVLKGILLDVPDDKQSWFKKCKLVFNTKGHWVLMLDGEAQPLSYLLAVYNMVV